MRVWTAALALLAAPTVAQDEVRFCPNRPDLGASGCTTLPGQVQLELSSIDWQRDDDAETREDTILGGDVQLRIGVGPRMEAQVSWTPYGHVRRRDKATGKIEKQNGVGDVRLAVRQSLAGPDGKVLSIGLEPFVTLPTGGAAIGAGDWGAGVLLPVTYDLSERWNLGFTGEADAAVDADGDGRHLAYSGIVGLGYALTEQLGAVAELMVARDDDPSGRETQALAAGSLAWQPRDRLQLDMLVAVGLNHNAPDVRLLTGGAILF